MKRLPNFPYNVTIYVPKEICKSASLSLKKIGRNTVLDTR